MSDVILFSPAAERNAEPIARALAPELPRSGLVLEIASGTGQHAVHFARRFDALTWQPSDPDPDARASVEARRAAAGLANLRAPIALDVRDTPWPVPAADAVIAINMIHIAPWECALALFRGAAVLLPSGAPLILYGPYFVPGRETAPSNLDFDRSLRARDPEWGLRDLAMVRDAAEAAGFRFDKTIPLPANNDCVVFRRA